MLFESWRWRCADLANRSGMISSSGIGHLIQLEFRSTLLGPLCAYLHVNAVVLGKNDWVMELETSLPDQKRRMIVAVLAVEQHSYGLVKWKGTFLNRWLVTPVWAIQGGNDWD